MELYRLVTQLVQKSQAIRSLITKLGELRFPSNSPRRLALLIGNIAQGIEEEVVEQYNAGPQSIEDFSVQVKFLITALRELAAHLRFIERAATRQTPWSLVYSLEKLGEQIHPDAHFIIRPQWSYNYSIGELALLYRNYFSQGLSSARLEAAFKYENGDPIKRMYVVGFPYIERLHVLMHALFGHELGHPIEKEYFDQEAPSDYVQEMNEAVLRSLGITQQTEQPDLITVANANQMLRSVLELRKRAIAEIICDLVGINLFGLAALLATEEYASSLEFDVVEKRPPHYPPWRYRLRIMLDELSEEWIEKFKSSGRFGNNIISAVDSKIADIRNIVSQQEDKRQLLQDTETRIAYDFVEKALPNIKVFVRERLKSRRLSLDDLIGATNNDLLERLGNWIPPDAYIAQGGEEISANIRSILNVGWLLWISNYSTLLGTTINQSDTKEYFKQTDALNRLVLKAIEYADLRTTWQQHKGTNGNGGIIE